MEDDQKELKDRQKQLKDLQDFLDNIEKDVTFILQGLNWSWNEVAKHKSLVQCPINSHHRLPADRLTQHLEVCKLRCEGYQDTDLLLPESTASETNAFSVKLRSESEVSAIIKTAVIKDPLFKSVRSFVIDAVNTNNSVANISQDDRPIPQTIERIQSTYTQDERRAIYDHIIKTTPKLDPPDDFTIYSADKDASKPKSEFESKAALRDLKRRRTKYKVSTKHKNYSEVLREVIKNQMEVHKEVLGHLSEERVAERNTNKHYTQEVTINQAKHREPKVVPSSSRDTNSTYNSREHKRENKEYESQYHKRERSRDNYDSFNKYHGKSNKRSRYEDDYYTCKDKRESSRSSDSSRHKNKDQEDSQYARRYDNDHGHNKSYKSSRPSSSKVEGQNLDDADRYQHRRKHY